MKPLNFIKPYYKTYKIAPSPLLGWQKTHTIFLAGIITSFIVINSKQLKEFFNIYHEYCELYYYTNQHKELHAEVKKLTKEYNTRSAKLKEIKQTKNIPRKTLLLIAKTITSDARLTEIIYTYPTLILKGKARSARALPLYIKALSRQKNFKHVILTHTEYNQEEKMLLFEIKIKTLKDQAA